VHECVCDKVNKLVIALHKETNFCTCKVKFRCPHDIILFSIQFLPLVKVRMWIIERSYCGTLRTSRNRSISLFFHAVKMLFTKYREIWKLSSQTFILIFFSSS
jgi:hypothetical protein